MNACTLKLRMDYNPNQTKEEKAEERMEALTKNK